MKPVLMICVKPHAPKQANTMIIKSTGIRLLVLFALLLISPRINAQNEDKRFDLRRRSITIGFLQGGGSIVGFDVETLISNQFGIQIGSGIIGFGGGVNYHFKPTIRSSFISLQYWHQGFGETYAQSLIGPSYVFRARKLFTFQGGIGYALDKGPGWPDNREQSPIMLLYSIGIYLPI